VGARTRIRETANQPAGNLKAAKLIKDCCAKIAYSLLLALMLLLGIGTSVDAPKDIYPCIDIPVVTIVWSYNGLPIRSLPRCARQELRRNNAKALRVVYFLAAIDPHTAFRLLTPL